MKRINVMLLTFLAGLLPLLPLHAFVPRHDLSAQPTNTTFGVQGPAFGIRRSFDPAGRLSTITASAGHSTAPLSLSYSPHDGGLAAVSNAVLSETRARDLLGNVTNITYRNASGTTVGQFRYRHDDTGLVTQRVGLVNGSTSTNVYAYDMLGRLTAADGVAYVYDPAGNRLSVSSVFSVVNNTYTHNRLDGVLHDAAGNVTRIVSASSVRELTWNTQNQLVSVTTNGVPAESYTYDPLGRRLSTTDTSGTVYHVYDGDHCAADLDASGTPLRTYIWGPGIDNLLAVTVYSADATNTYYAVKDHLGSVHALVDASGQLAAQFSYDAWGNVQLAVGSGQLARSSRFLFQGREYSWATGLYNFRARWYNPEWGRWLSPDPIGIEGGLNLYEFCHNDPVNFSDPSGLCAGGNGFWQDFWTRLIGLGQMLGGTAEAAAGYIFGTVTSPTVVGGIAGAAVGTHGIDNVQAGARQFWTGQQVDTMTSGLLQGAGLSRQTANTVNDIVSIAATLGMGAANMAAATATPYVQAGGAGPVAAAPTTVASVADDATAAISRRPNFIAAADGSVFPVPQGATGPLATRAPGMQFVGGSGGHGLDVRVTGVRFMDANVNQGSRAVYMNQAGQTVNPYTGRTVPYSDPTAHFYFNPNP